MDLPKYESLDTQVLGVSTDVVGALQAFAEKLSVTYPLLSDFSRETVQLSAYQGKKNVLMFFFVAAFTSV